MDESTGLENQRRESVRGFESHLFRQNFKMLYGLVVELADTRDLKSLGVIPVWVRVPPGPPF